MREQNGITLIALVITIIVLLILAGVTIAMLTGQNGILTRSTSATATNIEARVDEEVRLGVAALRVKIAEEVVKDSSYDATTTANGTALASALETDLKTTSGKTTYTASASGTTVTITYSDNDYKKATNNSAAVITYTFTLEQQGITALTRTAVDDHSKIK